MNKLALTYGRKHSQPFWAMLLGCASLRHFHLRQRACITAGPFDPSALQPASWIAQPNTVLGGAK